MLHAHHHDYTKPLDVTWLCFICHRREPRRKAPYKERPFLAGENNPVARFTNEQAAIIRSMHGSLRGIAKQFGTDHKVIANIKYGKTYKRAAPLATEKGNG